MYPSYYSTGTYQNPRFATYIFKYDPTPNQNINTIPNNNYIRNSLNNRNIIRRDNNVNFYNFNQYSNNFYNNNEVTPLNYKNAVYNIVNNNANREQYYRQRYNTVVNKSRRNNKNNQMPFSWAQKNVYNQYPYINNNIQKNINLNNNNINTIVFNGHASNITNNEQVINYNNYIQGLNEYANQNIIDYYDQYDQYQINNDLNLSFFDTNEDDIKPKNNISSFSIKKPCLVGLNNVGATCYMNATLQCLSNVGELTQFLLDSNRINTMKSNPNYKLTNAYAEVLQNLWSGNSIKDYSPYNFKNIISSMNPLFAGINANDSKDLILFLLETMHNELNFIKTETPNSMPQGGQYNYNVTFKYFFEYFSNNYRSVISGLFYGMFNAMMTCANCKTITNNIQCYNILIFPLEEVRIFKRRNFKMVNILECFEYYEHTEFLYGTNQIYCNRCKSLQNSYNKTKIIIAPNYLILNLNRGRGNIFGIKLIFEEYLDIKQFVFYNQSPYFYELIGVVTHLGQSGMSGHFIAYCKSFVDSQWYKFNDAMVDPCSFSEVTQIGIPYILFYKANK